MNGRGAIIAIDTATPSGSVAVRTADGAMFVRAGNEGEPYSTRLFRWLAEIRFEAGLVEPMSGLAAIAVSSGPGTFTGLRVGVATAKGLALAAGCPVLAFPTLELIARAAESPLALRRPVIAAGRGEVYTALHHVVGDACRQIEEERVFAPAGYSESAEGPVFLTGAGVALLDGIVLPPGSVIDATQLPLAPILIALAHQRLTMKPAPQGTRVTIRYVREAATTKSGNAAQ